MIARLAALPFALSACQSSTSTAPETIEPESVPPAELTAEQARDQQGEEAQVARTDPEPQVPDIQSPAALVDASNAFAADLWQTLLEEHENNVLVSPASVFLAFLMTEPGAAGNTQAQTAEVLRIDSSDAVHEQAAAFIERIQSDASPVVQVANRIWIDTSWDSLILPNYRQTVTSAYGAGVGSAPFSTAPEDARVSINEWVASQTNDRIAQLLPDGSIDDLVRAVLVNTIFFDAGWTTPFDPANTAEGLFETPGGPMLVAMMNQRNNLRLARGDGWLGVAMPYEGEEWSLVAVLPDDGADIDLFEAVDAVAAAHERSVDLHFPKFTYRHAFSVKEAMQRLGLRDAFQMGVADYSRMFTPARIEDLYISRAFHEAVIEFSEEGTEAAAATAIVMSVRGGRPPAPEVVRFDRTFEFVIRHNETGAVLFVGRVEDPTA